MCCLTIILQAIAAAEQAAEEAEEAAEASKQQLSTQLEEQAAENAKLKEQLKKLNTDLLDLRGQLEVQSTQQSLLEAREQQHQQQLQEQAAKTKEKAAELEAVTKELQVGRQGAGAGTVPSALPHAQASSQEHRLNALQVLSYAVHKQPFTARHEGQHICMCCAVHATLSAAPFCWPAGGPREAGHQ